MRLRAALPFLVLLPMVAAVSGCAKKEEPKPVAPPAPAVSSVEEGKALFEQKCSVCHGLDRATARKESEEGWETILSDMQKKKANWITDAEAEKIVDFLASRHGK